MPAAGKTGTAYDFTDALFAGYDSNLTCAVWAGFDKPQKIYRGAFGRELALPIWVDIMNAAAKKSPPREIKRPGNLKQIEICSRSGLLATDKCYDAVKTANGDTVQKRTTYTEIATPSQAPTESCNVHGEARARLAREFSASDLPRAALAVDLSEVTPVVIRSPTLLADNDPYNFLKPTLKPEPTPQPTTETADNQKIGNVASESHEGQTASNVAGQSRSTTQQGAAVSSPSHARDARGQNQVDSPTIEATPEIRKAIPVEPQDKKPVEIRRAIPVKPLDQEDVDQTFLKSAARPPGNLDE
jgi:membrane peptidoglycan carboxypeptidase